MPDQTLLGIAGQHPLDDLVRGLVLLVTADDLDASLLLVGGEQGETGENVQHHMRPQHAFGGELQTMQRMPLRVTSIRIQIPRPPILDRQAERTVVIFLALGGH